MFTWEVDILCVDKNELLFNLKVYPHSNYKVEVDAILLVAG